MTIEQCQTSPLPAPPVGTDVSRPPAVSRGPQVRTDVSRPLLRIATLGMVIVLLAGCLALLWQMQQGGSTGHAVSAIPAIPADVSVVGPPSLSAATINAIFAQYGSPMNGTGATIESLSRRYNIDDAFALGVWWTETNDGMAGVGSADRNPGSVRGSPGYPSAWDGYTIYPSYTAAIIDWFNILSGRYISSGLTTVFSIARPYVGTSSYPLWAGKVIALIYRYRGIAPPPPPVTSTPTPKPTPKPVPTLSPAMVVQQHRLSTLRPRVADFAYIRDRQGLDTEAISHTPAQITPPAAPLASSQTTSLSASFLSIIISCGLLIALLIALYALRIGRIARTIPVTKGATTDNLEILSQNLAILSPIDAEPALMLVGANGAPRPTIPLQDLVPLTEATMLPDTGRDRFIASVPMYQSAHPGRFETDAMNRSLSRWAQKWETKTDAMNRSLPETTPRPPRPAYLPPRPRQTDALPHRPLFLPAYSEQREPVAVGGRTEPATRPIGLLSRYKSES